jgi:hypothetical protein
MIEVVREGRNARNSDESKKTHEIEKNIADMEKRKRNLMLAVEDGGIDLSDVKDLLNELSKQIKILNDDLKKAKVQLSVLPPPSEWNLKKFRKQLMSFIELDRPIALKGIVDSFVERVTVYPDRVDVGIVLVCPSDKFNIQDAPKTTRQKHEKTAPIKSQSGLRDCKFNSGA